MSYEHCEKHDLQSTNGCDECDKEYIKKEQDRMLAKIDAQIRKDGIDPEKLTLSQAWSYFCNNKEWDL